MHFSVVKGLFSSFLLLYPISQIFALNVKKCELVGAYVSSSCNVEKLAKLKTKGINAVVINIKDDDGNILKDLNNGGEKVAEVVRQLKERGIYVIGRIVAFRDKKKVQERKYWAIRNKDGSVYQDKEKMSWLNPYNEEVQKYLIRLAKQATKLGFDEVQYDYIRFCSYKSLNDTALASEFAQKSRTEILLEFLTKAAQKVHKYGGKISVDVFGCVIPNLFNNWEKNQEVLGQDYEKMAEIVDYICPMIYPSHFTYNFVPIRTEVKDGKPRKIVFKAPDLHPYGIIKESLLASNDVVPKEKVRPWLQAFSAKWLKSGFWKKYDNADVQKQIDATTDNEVTQCCLWHPAGNYNILN